MSKNYHEDVKKKSIIKLREKLRELPPFLEEFFLAISDTKSPRTRLGYVYDLKIFFMYIIENNMNFQDKSLLTFTLEDFSKITATDIRRFMEYLSYYTKENNGATLEMYNKEKGKSRKLAAVRTMFSFYYKNEMIKSNPAELVAFPKLHNKAIVYLETDEIAELLNEVESGSKLTGRQKKFHQITKKRDVAIITLLLGTGIRISECVGINMEHINFNTHAVKITRKGGDEAVIYFGEEVKTALENYISERKNAKAKEGHETALFLSNQNKRITDRAIQNLVKKYSRLVISSKNITPHKLRSTYGTTLYDITGDIYLVSEVLGHEDVNTTKKHYAHMSEERKRKAADYIKLRS